MDCGLPLSVSALACAIAEKIDNTAELVALAALLTQLGDTLGTIAALRGVCGGGGDDVPQ